MFRLLPWRLIVRRAARAYGIADPALWLARIRQFSQPSEVQEPIELIRAGIHFHARGLVNTRAIQHKLDWVWPYWVERQFDPADTSFVPRAFSFSHINLTHRNWTAVGLPELSLYSIVDPRGLVTPLHDGWSLDFWLTDHEYRQLLPSQVKDENCRQNLASGSELAVETTVSRDDLELCQRAEIVVEDRQPVLKVSVSASSGAGGSLAVCVRPYNPEGVQFIDSVASLPDRSGWKVNDRTEVLTDAPADDMITSHYDHGDVVSRIASQSVDSNSPASSVMENCDQGMATAASIFQFDSDCFKVTVRVPLQKELESQGDLEAFSPSVSWADVHSRVAQLSVPDSRIQELYEAAVKTLILLWVNEIVPGPFTYKRFWFRDACLMMNPLLAIGLIERCERMLKTFPNRQQKDGYFRSQEGEWDSNGQVLWILNRYRKVTNRALPKAVAKTLDKAVHWIAKKRVSPTANLRHAGLLPAGFSAEHFGPNDHYYWDNFWAIAGAEAAEEIWTSIADQEKHRGPVCWRTSFARRWKKASPISPLPRLKEESLPLLIVGLMRVRSARWLPTIRCISRRRMIPASRRLSQCLPDFGSCTNIAAKRRWAFSRSHRLRGGTRIANGAMARSHSSPNIGRVYGRWPARLGRRRMGHDDSQLLCPRRTGSACCWFGAYAGMVQAKSAARLWTHAYRLGETQREIRDRWLYDDPKDRTRLASRCSTHRCLRAGLRAQGKHATH